MGPEYKNLKNRSHNPFNHLIMLGMFIIWQNFALQDQEINCSVYVRIFYTIFDHKTHISWIDHLIYFEERKSK